MVGGFYSDIDRDYAQRLPTPGYDAIPRRVPSAPETSAAVANGFPDLDSPYNADLPYDIRQKAVFGEASYDFGQFKLTGGGRYYDFNEEARLHLGRPLLERRQHRRRQDQASNGFSRALSVT